MKGAPLRITQGMNAWIRVIFAMGLCAAAAIAQPALDHISNAASLIPAPPLSEPNDVPLPNSAIALGSFFSVFGSGLASGTPNFWGKYPLPTMLAGTSIQVTVNGITSNALITMLGLPAVHSPRR